MLQVQEAVKHSLEAFVEIFPADEARGIRLEEVELSEDENLRLVTISYMNPDYERDLESRTYQSSGLEKMVGKTADYVRRRNMKKIKLRADNGSLVGITN